MERSDGATPFEQVSVGVGGDRKSVRHAYALGRELLVHLAERGVLASH